MVDGWLNLVKFLTTTLGVPGGLILAGLAYVMWLLKLERDNHDKTREKIHEVNEKRIELLKEYLKALGDFKVSLDALTSMVKK